MVLSMSIKGYAAITFTIIAMCGLILFYRKTPEWDSNFFTTHKGQIYIDEITKNVFEKSGYSLVKTDLVPILKRKHPQSCQKVFSEWQKVADQGLTIDPPKDVPDSDAFLMNGYAGLKYSYHNNVAKNTVGVIKTWGQEQIDGLVNIAINNPKDLPTTYQKESLSIHAATKHFDVTGQTGAVIGSLEPWAEPFILANGAKHVTTVDYQKINIQHSQMDFLYVLDLVAKSEKYYDKFDFIVSFSSIEHSGLGRYGDPIDPIGDIREINKIRCMLKPNGLLFLGFEVAVDSVLFNAHRIYGRIRLAMMFEGFRLLKVFFEDRIVSDEEMQYVLNNPGFNGQYLFVLQKIE